MNRSQHSEKYPYNHLIMATSSQKTRYDAIMCETLSEQKSIERLILSLSEIEQCISYKTTFRSIKVLLLFSIGTNSFIISLIEQDNKIATNLVVTVDSIIQKYRSVHRLKIPYVDCKLAVWVD